jgi:hypothetical protein
VEGLSWYCIAARITARMVVMMAAAIDTETLIGLSRQIKISKSRNAVRTGRFCRKAYAGDACQESMSFAAIIVVDARAPGLRTSS